MLIFNDKPVLLHNNVKAYVFRRIANTLAVTVADVFVYKCTSVCSVVIIGSKIVW